VAVIDSVLREELQRLRALRARYASQLAEIPGGSVVLKTKSGHKYAYLAYRKGSRVITDYVGPEASPKARQVVALFQKRRKILKEIKALDADAARLQKMINAG
jgi:hypothetical protein